MEWALETRASASSREPGHHPHPAATIRIEAGLIDERTLLGRMPTRRWIEPSEIAAAIVALIGGDFSALHGANVMIDAGYDAWGGHL